MSTDLEINMRTTTEAFLKAWEGRWILEPILAVRAPTCQQIILPKSWGTPPLNNNQFAEYLTRLTPLISNAKMIMDDYISVPQERKTISRSTMDAETPVGPFHNEYVWFLTFDEDGKKITEIVEMFDSKAALDWRTKVAEAGLSPKR